ncbi:unnamed protein product [Cuscuta campestris]|uniref:SWIM-type domain-containing protein n=1 Tax=Cuscuta campestris TaxID=132261 RepID=A0A484NKA2_9ASTE|nr:unnamed protein product [Cuscuta campestris]
MSVSSPYVLSYGLVMIPHVIPNPISTIPLRGTHLPTAMRAPRVVLSVICTKAAQVVITTITVSYLLGHFRCLRHTVKEALDYRPVQCVISDRHEGIISAVNTVFPGVSHGHCIYHIFGNIKHNFRGSQKSLSWKFYGAARAASKAECYQYLQYLEQDDPRIIPYLDDIGFEKWARSFSTNRYSIMTSNLAESMNSVDAVPREYPIARVVDFLLVRPASNFEFLVIETDGRSFVVNFQDRTCTCGEFQLDNFVCVHAVAVTRQRPGLSCYDYVSPYYTASAWSSAYNGVVHPIPSKDLWVLPDDVHAIICKPPTCSKRPPGRPKKRRIPSRGYLVPEVFTAFDSGIKGYGLNV